MIRQYYAPRFRTSQPTTTGNANMRIGTIPVGTILYIQDSVSPLHASTRAAGCREPWIVEAWLPRDYATWDPFLRRFKTVQMAGGHLAVARSLRDRNRLRTVADWILVASMDAGLEKLA